MKRCVSAGAALWCVLFSLGPCLTAASTATFDHFVMGFELEGRHVGADCESCHVNGVFGGTPRVCQGCHDGSSLRAETYKSTRHPRTTDDCGACHVAAGWEAIPFVDHEEVLGTCIECHNGSSAEPKPTVHPLTGDSCGDCHSTLAWIPAVFDHADVLPGTCSSCHNGANAEGKTQTHLVTTAECDACHSTVAWTPAIFEHADVTPGSCSVCHDGSTATGTPNDHFLTNDSCDRCHSTISWTPQQFSHQAPDYPGDHRRSVPCTACHGGNSEAVTWRFPSYQPDCAGCHANDFKAGSHKKVDSPQILYTVSELRDCTGACHQYTNSSFTTILKNRPGPEHRVNSGDW